MSSWMILASIGIAWPAWLPTLPATDLRYLALGLSILLWISPKSAWRTALLSFLLGSLWGLCAVYRVAEALLPPELETQPLRVSGTVVGLPKLSRRGEREQQQFYLAADSPLCSLDGRCHAAGGLLRLNAYQHPMLRSGQRWQLLVKLKRPHGTANPGGFDYQRWLVQQRVIATGYVKSDPDNRLLGNNRWSLSYYRGAIARHLQRALADNDQQALLKALLIADNSAIDAAQWALFRRSGTVHLMIISGLHIGMIAVVGFLLGRLLAALSALDGGKCTAISTLVVVLAYSAAAGFSLPTQRAAIMVSLLMYARYHSRCLGLGRGLSCAAFLCLLCDPLATLSWSFWLSFAAVGAIVYSCWGQLPEPGRLAGMLRVQLAAFLGLLPLLVAGFGQLSLLSPLANLLAVPVFSLLVVPLNFVALPVSYFQPALAHSLWQAAGWVLHWVLRYLGWLDQHAGALVLDQPGLPMSLLAAAVLATVILLAPRGTLGKSVALVSLLLILLWRPALKLKPGELEIDILDVGQGLSVLIRSRHHSLLYDVGADYGGDFSMAAAVVQPFLRHRAITGLDRLVLSHADKDHAGNWLLIAPAASELFVGEPIAGLVSHRARRCVRGQRWRWDEVDFEFLWPPAAQSKLSSNNRSCVLRVRSATTQILLTGDIEKPIEQQLLDLDRDILRSDILIAPHHGSRSSSSTAFIAAVHPRYVVFTAGYRNRFQHPHREVVARYQALGSVMLDSASSGAIRFSLRNTDLLRGSSYRSENRHFWDLIDTPERIDPHP